MATVLTSQAKKALDSANDVARSFNHAYVGTEHILLALVEDDSTDLPYVLAALHISAQKIRAEIERIVARGPAKVTLRTLPFTPRAKQAIESASQETVFMSQKSVGPAHLFLGLVNDRSGVACQVLLNLGIRPDELRKEVFKARLAQMKIVERAVRPVRASTPRKRKMREELLAHLAAIYDQELAQVRSPEAALAAAEERFGNPEELAHQLQAALPFHERFDYFSERLIAWRAPESVVRYACRQALLTLGMLGALCLLLSAWMVLRHGWTEETWTVTRVLTALALITPPSQFVFTFAWIKMRNSLWGVFGSRKSLVRAFFYGAAIASIVFAAFLTFAATANWNLSLAIDTWPLAATAGVLAAAATFIAVLLSGAATIRDTIWAMLEVQSA